MQQYWIGLGKTARLVSLPPPDEEVVQGVRWGRADALDTAAYWALRCSTEPDPLKGFKSDGGCLAEEIGFCLLGGFGITAEVNVAAFERLKAAEVFELTSEIPEERIRELLLEPLVIGGSLRRYRFPNQRASRLAGMREHLRTTDLEALTPQSASSVLRKIVGIGPKTAAWIIRNHFDSDEVAILDVHVIRACARMNLFPPRVNLPRDYEGLQERFLSFASAIDVRAAVLDAVMWTEMRNERLSARLVA